MRPQENSEILTQVYKGLENLLLDSSFYKSELWFKNGHRFGATDKPKNDGLIIKALRIKKEVNKTIVDLNLTLLNNRYGRSLKQARMLDLIIDSSYNNGVNYYPVFYQNIENYELRYINRSSIYTGFNCVLLFYTSMITTYKE